MDMLPHILAAAFVGGATTGSALWYLGRSERRRAEEERDRLQRELASERMTNAALRIAVFAHDAGCSCDVQVH